MRYWSAGLLLRQLRGEILSRFTKGQFLMTNILSYYHNLRCRDPGLLLVVKYYNCFKSCNRKWKRTIAWEESVRFDPSSDISYQIYPVLALTYSSPSIFVIRLMYIDVQPLALWLRIKRIKKVQPLAPWLRIKRIKEAQPLTPGRFTPYRYTQDPFRRYLAAQIGASTQGWAERYMSITLSFIFSLVSFHRHESIS